MARKIARRAEIPPFYVMEVMRAADKREQAADGANVLHLEVGQPSTPAPKGVIEAAHRALDSDLLGYTDAIGIPELRSRIALHYGDWYDIDLDPQRVLVTQGASGACVFAFLAYFDVGDRVAVCSPGYACYKNILAAFGCDVVDVRVGADTRFQPTPELLEEAGPLDGIVIASPSNPTGTMLGPAELAALITYCDEHGIRLISDEIYHGITYGQSAPTALQFSDDAVVMNSFSKYFSMTGWRLGWLVVPENAVTPVEHLAQNLTVAPPTLSQLAAVAAFDCHDELQANVDRYAENRKILLEGLPTAGLDKLAPVDGAFYIYADVSDITDDSQDLCNQWLTELGIAVTPGIDFDPGRGHEYVRFSFAGATTDMTEAARRLDT